MKKNSFTCPKCGSKTAREWLKERYHIFDQEFYETMKREFVNPDCDNYYIAKCICDDCDNHFEAKVIINVETISIEIM